MLVMLLSVFFITAIWRGGPGFWSFGGRAVKMMGHWTDVAILDGPLLVAALSGYGLYVWTLKGGKDRRN